MTTTDTTAPALDAVSAAIRTLSEPRFTDPLASDDRQALDRALGALLIAKSALHDRDLELRPDRIVYTGRPPASFRERKIVGQWHRMPAGWLIRLGKPTWRCFSERYQGTNGIPIRFHYLFGQRITFRKAADI